MTGQPAPLLNITTTFQPTEQGMSENRKAFLQEDLDLSGLSQEMAGFGCTYYPKLQTASVHIKI